MTSDRRALLEHLLRALAKEWSRTEINDALDTLNSSSSGRQHDVQLPKARKAKENFKPTAKQIAEQCEALPHHKKLVMDIADRYDRKEFLPTIGDVRNFLQMRGRDASNIKQRPESFRRILNLMLDLPTDFLQRIIDDRLYSGPADLGPLSDAINEVGEKRRANN